MGTAFCNVLAHLDQLHHAPIFMSQDVTVMYIDAGEIDEPAAHLEVAVRDHEVSVWILLRCRDRERVPPDKVLVELLELLSGGGVRVKDLDDLKRVHMNMERVGGLRGRVIDRPLLDGVKLDLLIDDAVFKLLAVDR